MPKTIDYLFVNLRMKFSASSATARCPDAKMFTYFPFDAWILIVLPCHSIVKAASGDLKV